MNIYGVLCEGKPLLFCEHVGLVYDLIAFFLD